MKKILLVALSCLVVGTVLGLSFNASAQVSPSIPSWVKSTAKYWVSGDVSDSDFIKAIQWMVTQGIITVPTNSPTSSANSNSQTTTSVTSNPLQALLPTNNDVGSLWKILDSTSSSRFNVEASPAISPYHTIEQIFEKTTSTPMTVITIDVATFNPGAGLSYPAQNEASRVYGILKADYLKQNTDSGFSQSSFIPNPSDSRAVCYMFTITKTQSTKIDMFCAKGYTVFVIDATGNDLSMTDDVKMMTNLMLPKLIAY